MSKKKVLPDESLSAFFYQLALMTHAGISPEEGIFLLLEDAEEENNPMQKIHERLAEGEALSSAMRSSGLFPDYALRMLEIGELAGRQEQVLESLSAFYQREHSLKQSIHQAIAYPAVMAVLIGAVFLVLVGRVLPVFSGVFDQLGLSLSPVAAMLMRFGSVSKYIAGALSIALLALIAVLFVLYRAGKVKETSIIRGETARCVARSRFSSAMALMLSSGLPIDDAVERVQLMLADTPLAEAVRTCGTKLLEGMSFSQAAESCKIFPSLETGLLRAGCRAGVTDQAMEELARRCQAQAEERLGRFLGRFQYGLVIVLCVAVGLVLLSVMLPLLGVLATIGA